MQDETGCTASFAVRGDASPHLIGRVTGLIAQQGLVPLAVTMRRVGDEAHLHLVQDGLCLQRAAILVEKMRSLVLVASVELQYTNTIKGNLL